MPAPLPKDVQQEIFKPVFPANLDIPGYKIESTKPHASDKELTDILNLIGSAKRPILYIGGGIISADAHIDAKQGQLKVPNGLSSLYV